jgi:hypothetical protein
MDKVALGQLYSEYFRFLCQSFHRLLHTHLHPTSEAGAIGQIVANVSSQLFHSTPQNEMKTWFLAENA